MKRPTVPTVDARVPLPRGLTLLEVLAEPGLRTEDSDFGRKKVLDADGNVLLAAATAGDVWAWLRSSGGLP